MYYTKKDPKILCATFDKGSDLYSGCSWKLKLVMQQQNKDLIFSILL